MPIDRTQRDPLDLQRELERAVERNEFGVEYQPIIDLQSGAPVKILAHRFLPPWIRVQHADGLF